MMSPVFRGEAAEFKTNKEKLRRQDEQWQALQRQFNRY